MGHQDSSGNSEQGGGRVAQRAFLEAVCVVDCSGGDHGACPANACGRSPRAPLVLARPCARHQRQPARRRRGAHGALARVGHDRRGPRPGPGRVQGRGRRAVARPPARVHPGGQGQGRLQAAPEPAEGQDEQEEVQEAEADQQGPGRGLRLRLGPGGRVRRWQQRPHRDHARPVSGVGFAEPAGERSDLHPRPSAGGRQRRPDAQLRVPGDLPERPEPDLRPGPRGGRRARSSRRDRTGAGSRSRSSANACAATSRSRAPG